MATPSRISCAATCRAVLLGIAKPTPMLPELASDTVAIAELIPITLPPANSVTIGGDGTISIVAQGDATGTPQIVDRLKLASTKGTDTVKGLDNLLRVRGGGTLPADLDAKVEGGALEGSNVNMTQALIDMIETSREWDMQVKMMSAAQDIDKASTDLMRFD